MTTRALLIGLALAGSAFAQRDVPAEKSPERNMHDSPGAAYAQLGAPPPAAPAPAPAAKPAGAPAVREAPTVVREAPADPLSPQGMVVLERNLDRRISSCHPEDPCIIIGPSRGLYMAGFGAIFTGEVDLVASPQTIFMTTISQGLKEQVHKRKTAQLPILEKAMREMMLVTASSLKSMPDTEQIVLAIRFLYRPWEDTTGLPAQVLMRGGRKDVLNGDIKTERQ